MFQKFLETLVDDNIENDEFTIFLIMDTSSSQASLGIH